MSIHSTYAGFARAIYFQLTNIRIEKEYDSTDRAGTRSTIRNEIVEIASVYPNPNSSNRYTIELSTTEIVARYRIYNTMGMQVHTGILNDSKTSIELNTTTSGVYFIEIIQGATSQVIKLLRI